MTTAIEALEEVLNRKVIGQPEAIHRVAQQLAAGEMNLNDTGKRPKASLLLMGGTGIGKTSTAKALSEHVFGVESLEIIPMNELQNPMDVITFANRLYDAADRYPKGGVLLCDEIEKTIRQIMDLFISLLDEGCIYLNKKPVWFSNWYVIMTSNIGADQWGDMRHMKYSRMIQFARDQASKTLRPELMHRISDVIVYRPLSQEVQLEILRQAIEAKKRHLRNDWGDIYMGDVGVVAYLLGRCFSLKGGARALKSELDKEINQALIPWGKYSQRPQQPKMSFNPGKQRLELI